MKKSWAGTAGWDTNYGIGAYAPPGHPQKYASPDGFVNVLFCDGHVATVAKQELYNNRGTYYYPQT